MANYFFFTYCLGRTKGVTGYEWWTWIAGFAALYVLSAVLLAKATQTLPIGTAYPVWTGIGAVGAVLVGIFVFREPATFWRLFFSYDAHRVDNRTKNYFVMELVKRMSTAAKRILFSPPMRLWKEHRY